MTTHNPNIIHNAVQKRKGYKRLHSPSKMTSQSTFYRHLSEDQQHPNVILITRNTITADSVRDAILGKIVNHIPIIQGSFVNLIREVENNCCEVEMVDCMGRRVVAVCRNVDLLKIDKVIYEMAVAIEDRFKRVQFVKDTELCNRMKGLNFGDYVYFLCNDEMTTCPATVKYIGNIPSLGEGTRFGLELQEPNEECDCDGTIGDKRYFTCEPTKGVIVAANRITASANSVSKLVKNFDRLNHSNSSSADSKLNNNEWQNKDLNDFLLNVDDRVICYPTSKNPIRGTLCLKLSDQDSVRRIHKYTEGGKAVYCQGTSCDGVGTLVVPKKEMIPWEEFDRDGWAKKVGTEWLVEMRDVANGRDVENGPDVSKLSWKITKEAPISKFIESDERNGSTVSFGDTRWTAIDVCDVPGEENPYRLHLGSIVKFREGNQTLYGVIKWIGSTIISQFSDPIHYVAGIELDHPHERGNDSTIGGQRKFDCSYKSAWFVSLRDCQPDTRLTTDIDDEIAKDPVLSAQKDIIVPGVVEPVRMSKDLDAICGKSRGIQGHNNSCYLDATLFSMFTFTSVVDTIIYRPTCPADAHYFDTVQSLLRNEIVNPLRQNLFVTARQVMKLRLMLDALSTVTGLTNEEKDPEEFIHSLLNDVLKSEPFIKFTSRQNSFFYQVFVERDDSLPIPSVQQLLTQSMIISNVKFTEVPSCLIIQMPRFGSAFKMYPRILPSRVLDITDMLENVPRRCFVCGALSEFECYKCYNNVDGSKKMSYCGKCVETVHSHEERSGHTWKKLAVHPDVISEYKSKGTVAFRRQFMELFAVLCINTSHYVTFARCGPKADDPWCFFDSMADRKGGRDGYNIPEVVPCPFLNNWISDDGLKHFQNIPDEKHLPEQARRLMCDAYMCMYQSVEAMMYK